MYKFFDKCLSSSIKQKLINTINLNAFSSGIKSPETLITRFKTTSPFFAMNDFMVSNLFSNQVTAVSIFGACNISITGINFFDRYLAHI